MSAGTLLLAQRLSRFWPLSGQEPAPAGTWSPDVDAVERGDSFVARIDLPGTPLSDVHVEISEDEVTVYGQRPRVAHDRGDTWSHAERAYGWFFRVLPLPVGAWAGGATATFRDGVLEVNVPLTAPDAATGSPLDQTTLEVRRA